MRIFVSSSFEDLREHRAAAIRVLRQLGHEVVAMEDMVSGPLAPLDKVLEMVDRCEAYVGLFAWRYGYVPGAAAAEGRRTPPPASKPPGGERPVAVPRVKHARYGETSITHYEYLRAKERKIPILAFLLDENVPVAPTLVDGFDRSRPGAPADTSCIRTLREDLRAERVVAWFSTPSDLEARVAAAVTSVGLSRQIEIHHAVSPGVGAGSGPVFGSHGNSIAEAVVGARTNQRVFKVDLTDTWWSTRLFLIATLAEHLTQVRRILVVERPANGLPPVRPPSKPKDAPAEFIGLLSTAAVIGTIGPMTPALGRFRTRLQRQPVVDDDLRATTDRYLGEGWARAFGPGPDPYAAEGKVAVVVSAEHLRRWFGDAMLQQPVEVTDLKRASVVDLMRLLDYPSDFVPVMSQRIPDRDEPTGDIEVIDKAALTSRLARSYLDELKEQARIT